MKSDTRKLQEQKVRALLEADDMKKSAKRNELLPKQARLLRHLQENVSRDELTGSSPLAQKPKG